MILTKFHSYGAKTVNLFIDGQFKALIADFMIQSILEYVSELRRVRMQSL